MKKIVTTIVYTSLLILIQEAASAQNQPQQPKEMPNKDSMVVRTVRKMEQDLKLNKSQATAVLDASKKQQKALDSLNTKKTLTPEQRAVELKQIQKDFNEQLKKVLSNEQLDAYKTALKKRRDSLLENAKSKKMTIKELEGN